MAESSAERVSALAKKIVAAIHSGPTEEGKLRPLGEVFNHLSGREIDDFAAIMDWVSDEEIAKAFLEDCE